LYESWYAVHLSNMLIFAGLV